MQVIFFKFLCQYEEVEDDDGEETHQVNVTDEIHPDKIKIHSFNN